MPWWGVLITVVIGLIVLKFVVAGVVMLVLWRKHSRMTKEWFGQSFDSRPETLETLNRSSARRSKRKGTRWS